VAEDLTLFTAAIHPARISHLLVAVEAILLEGTSMHSEEDPLVFRYRGGEEQGKQGQQ
jgi:hypothetical protein